jgi:hypothetical protein
VRLQLHTLALKLGKFQAHTGDPEDGGAVVAISRAWEANQIVTTVVRHGRYVTFQMAEVAVPRQMFADILSLIAWLRAPVPPGMPEVRPDAGKATLRVQWIIAVE